MSVHKDRSEWQDSEARTLAGLDLPVEHWNDYADAGAGRAHFDAVATSPIGGRADLPLIGLAYVRPGTRLELKTCQVWISNGPKRRRGRITLYEENHARRLEENVSYLLGVREDVEDRELLAVTIVSPHELDRLVSGRWTTTTRNGGGRVAQIPWNKLLAESVVDAALEEVSV